MDLLFLLGGLVVLYFGGEFFINGSTRLAALLGMSPLLIGLTVVAFGTSAPELGVSLQAALDGHASIAMGNVAGSNIFNTFVVLGLSALFAPLAINRQLIRLDVPVMIAASLIMGFYVWDGSVSRTEGFSFLVMAVLYNGWLVVESRRQKKQQEADADFEMPKKTFKDVGIIALYMLGGLIGLYFGSKWTVQGAVGIAQQFGISERIIAITIISVGTSLPELATSVVATMKGQRDLAVGNVVGSNIMNILLILGATASVSSIGVDVADELKNLDIPLAIFGTILCFPFFLRNVMSRAVGTLFLSIYIGYIVYIL